MFLLLFLFALMFHIWFVNSTLSYLVHVEGISLPVLTEKAIQVVSGKKLHLKWQTMTMLYLWISRFKPSDDHSKIH